MRIARTLVLLIAIGTLHADVITLTPGSLLVQAVNLSNFSGGIIQQYNPSGTLLASGTDSGLHDIAENLTVLNGNLYVSDGAGYVNRIDLSSGNSASSFFTGTFGLNGIGSLNGNLLALTFNATAVHVYSTSGVLLQTVNLASLPSSLSWNGIASDGTTLYLADSTSGRIYEYSTSGTLLGFISTAAVNGLTGVSYDSSNNSLWITDTVTNQVIDLSTTGSQLSEFSLGSYRPGSGIAVIPGASTATATPEPDFRGLLLISLLLLATVSLSKRGQRTALLRKSEARQPPVQGAPA